MKDCDFPYSYVIKVSLPEGTVFRIYWKRTCPFLALQKLLNWGNSGLGFSWAVTPLLIWGEMIVLLLDH